jgi:hypothetical protein
MAEKRVFQCDTCRHSVAAWSDGNPYYLEHGRKHYAYHPHHAALARCIGNDTPFLCLACAASFTVDSHAPRATCPECAATAIVALWCLERCRCPFCRQGHFLHDPESGAIS